MSNRSTPRPHLFPELHEQPWFLVGVAFLALVCVPGAGGAQSSRSPSHSTEARWPAAECWTDAATGSPTMGTLPGVCVDGARSSNGVVLQADGGLLFLAPDGDAPGVRERNPDATHFLKLFDQRARLLYCPAQLLDPLTGSAGANCLTDYSTLSPGPGAFVGVGTTQASVIFDHSGAAQCPSSVHVSGSLTGPSGDLFDLSSLLVLAEGRTDCVVVREQMRLDYSAPRESSLSKAGRSPEELAQLNDAQWALVDELVRLGDDDWQVLDRLLALPPGELELLDSHIAEDGAASISASGRVQRRDWGAAGEGDTVVNKADIQDVFNIVTTLKKRVPFKLPNATTIRGLYSTIPVGQLIDLIDVIKPMILGVLNMINDLRDGFEEREGLGSGEAGNCGTQTECGAFKAEVEGVLDQLLDAWDKIQSVGCLGKPDLVKRPLPGIGVNQDDSPQLIRGLLVVQAPNILLYGLYRFLGLVEGWETMVEDVMASWPDLTGLCTGGRGLEVNRCDVLRPKDVELGLLYARTEAQLGLKLVEALKSSSKDDVAATAAVTAVGGAGAGTNAKDPVDTVLKVMEALLKGIEKGAGEGLSERKECLAADTLIERDLGTQPSCLVLSEYTISSSQGGRYEEVRGVVERRKSSMNDAGISTPGVQTLFNDAAASEGTRTGFDYLCSAYRELNGSGGDPIALRTGEPCTEPADR